MENMLVMHEDTVVLEVNFDEGLFKVNREDLLPFPLKGKLRPALPDKEMYSKYELTQAKAISLNNNNAVIDWLAGRTLSLSRKNAKWIFNLLNIEQLNTTQNRAKIAIVCRAVSLLDNYWLKMDGDAATWAETNLRHNKLNEVIAQVALHGKSLTLRGSMQTPELTTNGAYAKAWRRHEDESLWLYKLGEDGNTEARIEVMCSNLLDKTNVEHCHYEAGEDEGKFVCMCPCMADDDTSILSGMDFISYCNVNGLDPDKEMLKIDAESIYKMWIVDYLISNRDRHGQNWGFFYKPDTMEITKCHPLFDHNNAFDSEFMKNPDSHYQFGNMTIRQAAMYAMEKVDFHFTDIIKREDFITERQYKSFMERAEELGIKIKNYEINKPEMFLKEWENEIEHMEPELEESEAEQGLVDREQTDFER